VEALVLNGKQETVYVLDGNNRIHIRNVAVGLQGSKLAEITNGLNPGDLVVIGGQDKYQENEEVNVLLTPGPASETAQQTGGMIDMKAETSDGGAH